MSRFIKTKRASEVLDYTIDWFTKGWLESSETISTSTWGVASGITENSDSNTTTTTTIWLSGGTAGQTYKVTNTITTSNSPSRTRVRDMWIKIL